MERSWANAHNNFPNNNHAELLSRKDSWRKWGSTCCSTRGLRQTSSVFHIRNPPSKQDNHVRGRNYSCRNRLKYKQVSNELKMLRLRWKVSREMASIEELPLTEIIIRALIRAHVVRFIFCVRSNNASSIWAISACGVPHIATISSIVEEIVSLIPIRHHPILVSKTVNTIQLVRQIWEIFPRPATRRRLHRAIRIYSEGEWSCFSFANFDAIGRIRVGLAALFRCTIDNISLGLMHFTLTETSS
mmetsp:Transcript_21937/g.44974  ORF Transcript_21937/g.44974 Transcript_21937/m.44974 type:complete len:245 (-) Transcript_21937:139-873(-)